MNIRNCTLQLIGNNIYIVKKGMIIAAFATATKPFILDNPSEHNAEAIYSALKYAARGEKTKAILNAFADAQKPKAKVERKPKAKKTESKPKTDVVTDVVTDTAGAGASAAVSAVKPIRVEPKPK